MENKRIWAYHKLHHNGHYELHKKSAPSLIMVKLTTNHLKPTHFFVHNVRYFYCYSLLHLKPIPTHP